MRAVLSRTAAMDPDVIVLCPMESGDFTLSGTGKTVQDNGRYVKSWSHKTNAWLQNGSFIERYEDTIRRVSSEIRFPVVNKSCCYLLEWR